jgi:hypothetical protein
MKKNTVKIDGNQITIIAKKSNIFARAFMWFMILVCTLIPIWGSIALVSFGEGLHISIVIGFLLFWATAAFLTRAILWNTFGKEIINLNEKSIEYIADYKYYKDGRTTLDVTKAEFELAEFIELRNKKLWTIRIKAGGKILQTVLKLDAEQCEIIDNELKNRYDKGFL